MSFAKRRLSFAVLKQAVDATAKLSAFVMMILIGSRVFGLTFYGLNGNLWIEHLMLSLPGAEYGFLFFVTVLVFILGCFLDFFEIAFVVIPLLGPVAEKLGIDLIWFGIILGINLQTSFLTPPFGFSLFYLRSIAPASDWKDAATGKIMKGVRTVEIYKGVLPYIIIQIVMIGVVIAFPQLVMVYKSGEKPLDPSLKITVPMEPAAGSNGLPNLGLPPIGGGLPGMSLPPIGGDAGKSGTAPGLPGIQLAPLNGLNAPADAAKPANPKPGVDLSQPPKFN
jgi:hypothetical protein